MIKQRRVCEVCDKPQFTSYSGWVCKNGHGGAPYYIADIPDYKAQRFVWHKENITALRKRANEIERGSYPKPKCKKCDDFGVFVVKKKGLLEKKTCTDCKMHVKKQKNDICRSVGEYVWKTAEMCFQDCPKDFCIQDNSREVIVFGGTNRLIWSAFKGFRIDESYCTKKFIKKAKEVLGHES